MESSARKVVSASSHGTLERALAVLRARAVELQARGVLHASVFGSVARGEDSPESDLDLVFEVRLGAVDSIDIMSMERALAAEVGREVQVISRCGLDQVRHAAIFRDMVQAF
jgi:predicted nucleotidyltransferase